MTYPKEFSEIQRARLALLIPKIEALAPGQSLLVEAKSLHAAEEIKYLLYAWLSPKHSARKDEFRIRRAASPLSFHVFRLDTTCEFSVRETPVETGEHPRLVEIVHLLDEEEVNEAIRAMNLPLPEAIRLLNEWKQIHC